MAESCTRNAAHCVLTSPVCAVVHRSLPWETETVESVPAVGAAVPPKAKRGKSSRQQRTPRFETPANQMSEAILNETKAVPANDEMSTPHGAGTYTAVVSGGGIDPDASVSGEGNDGVPVAIPCSVSEGDLPPGIAVCG